MKITVPSQHQQGCYTSKDCNMFFFLFSCPRSHVQGRPSIKHPSPHKQVWLCWLTPPYLAVRVRIGTTHHGSLVLKDLQRERHPSALPAGQQHEQGESRSSNGGRKWGPSGWIPHSASKPPCLSSLNSLCENRTEVWSYTELEVRGKTLPGAPQAAWSPAELEISSSCIWHSSPESAKDR